MGASGNALAAHGLTRDMKVAFDHQGRTVVLAEDAFDNLFAPQG